jgi:hypothetical protein
MDRIQYEKSVTRKESIPRENHPGSLKTPKAENAVEPINFVVINKKASNDRQKKLGHHTTTPARRTRCPAAAGAA